MKLDEWIEVRLTRRQAIIVLQAIDAMRDDAEWMPVASSPDEAIAGGEMVNIRSVDIDDVCVEHVGDLLDMKRHLDELDFVFDMVLASDYDLSAWARETIAGSLHMIERPSWVDDEGDDE